MKPGTTTIVYVYAHKFARAPYKDELRWSLRSLANIRGQISPLIVGDPPEWYTGPKIVMPTIKGKYNDTTAKFIAAATSPLVSDPFITLMDDTVVWDEIELADLATPRHFGTGIPKERRSHWAGHLRRTLQACEAFGFTTFDTATHWPYPFEKKKLLETIDTFEAKYRPVCLEVAYPNQHGQTCVPAGKEFTRCRLRGLPNRYTKVLNYGQITPQLRDALRERFPDRSQWESDDWQPIRPEPPLHRSMKLAADGCVHLGQPTRLVRNQGGGRSQVFFCRKFDGECTLGHVRGIQYACSKCSHREPSGIPVFSAVEAEEQ